MYQVRDIKLEEIKTSALNPRKTFDQAEIDELAQSIKENGLIQAITLRKIKPEEGIKYEVVCGERRFRAVKSLGEETIQAVVKELDDKQAFACMVIENLQRKDIDPLEEASALRYLNKESGIGVKEIAKIIGKSQSFVVNRILLNNVVEEFIKLMRDGILNLSHLQEIAKLTKEQQLTLLEACFKPEMIERWNFKTLSAERIKEWIDDHVMCHISTAKFDPEDDTYKTCKSCVGCKFNTASRSTFKDFDNPRCMKQEWFVLKNREAVFRRARDLGFPPVYVGNADENKTILKAAEEYLLYPQPLGNREYLVEPLPPSPDGDPDDYKYQRRMANYQRIRAVFEDNIHAGLVIKVFEICYNGQVTGEVKYLFNLKADEVGKVDDTEAVKAEQLTMYRSQLRATDEARKTERVERQRNFLEEAPYTFIPNQWDETEEDVFLAVMVSRLPQEFRKIVGMDYESAVDITSAFPKLRKCKNQIMREYIRMNLSDKSVGYSEAFSSLLDLTLRHSFSNDVVAIDSALAQDYEQKCKDYEARISELEKELKIQKASTEEPIEPEVKEDSHPNEQGDA